MKKPLDLIFSKDFMALIKFMKELKAETLKKSQKGHYLTEGTCLLLIYKDLNMDNKELVKRLVHGKLMYNMTTKQRLTSKVEYYVIQKENNVHTCLLKLKDAVSNMKINSFGIYDIQPKVFAVKDFQYMIKKVKKGDFVEGYTNNIPLQKEIAEQNAKSKINNELENLLGHLKKDLEELLEMNFEVMNKIEDVQSHLNFLR